MRLNERYPATYSDSYGQEQAIIEVEPDGQFLSLRLRGTHFRGLFFDVFYVWPPDQNPENLQRFHLRKVYIPDGHQARPTHQRLENYLLQWSMPVQVAGEDHIVEGILRGTMGDVSPCKEYPYGLSHLELALQIGTRIVKVEGNNLRMREALVQLQKRLAPEMYLKCCQFCAFSVSEPSGMSRFLCFKKAREEIKTAKKKVFRTPSGVALRPTYPAQLLWNRQREAEYTQGTYACSEFEREMFFPV